MVRRGSELSKGKDLLRLREKHTEKHSLVERERVGGISLIA